MNGCRRGARATVACRAVASPLFGALKLRPTARLIPDERLQAGRPRDTALAEPSRAEAGAKARFPQTGDCVANVSARPRATVACRKLVEAGIGGGAGERPV